MNQDPAIHAYKKLAEVEYFLDQIDRGHSDAYEYHVSGFFSAWRSVFDIILYDASEKFGLGFSRQKRMPHSKFLEVAEQKNHVNAIYFHKWWKRKLTKISEHPLYKIRSFVIHRGIPMNYLPNSITIDVTSSFSTAYNISFSDFDGYSFPVEIDIAFSTFNRGFQKMKDIVDEAVSLMT